MSGLNALPPSAAYGCCANAAGSYYSHPCGCPYISVNMTQTAYFPQLEGWWEFAGYTSSPPVLYKQYVVTWTGCVYNYSNTPSPSENYQLNFSSNGTVTWPNTGGGAVYDTAIARSGYMPGTTYDALFSGSACILNSSGPSCGGVASGDQVGWLDGLGSPFLLTVDFISATQFNLTTNAQSNTPGPGQLQTLTLGNASTQLSDADTDLDAIGRASGDTYSFSEYPGSNGAMPDDNCYSEWDVRSGLTTVGFNYIIGSYTISLSALVTGQKYKVSVVIQKRSATYDESSGVTYGAWEADTTNVITFTADGTTHTSSSYNLPTDSTDSGTQGWQYAITAVYCEFA
jgi:hypothetical protein